MARPLAVDMFPSTGTPLAVEPRAWATTAAYTPARLVSFSYLFLFCIVWSNASLSCLITLHSSHPFTVYPAQGMVSRHLITDPITASLMRSTPARSWPTPPVSLPTTAEAKQSPLTSPSFLPHPRLPPALPLASRPLPQHVARRTSQHYPRRPCRVVRRMPQLLRPLARRMSLLMCRLARPLLPQPFPHDQRPSQLLSPQTPDS